MGNSRSCMMIMMMMLMMIMILIMMMTTIMSVKSNDNDTDNVGSLNRQLKSGNHYTETDDQPVGHDHHR